jgi:prepilin-type N-terminal cleavage/methylation domain-containing protein
MKRGYTLVEVALALAVAGLLLGIALPSFTALKQGVKVESAAQSIAAAHRRARTTAIVHGRAAILSVAARTLRITLVGAERPHWTAPGPAEEGVTLASPARDLTFSPLGITTGLSNASFHLTAGSSARTVVVSRLGRVRITRSP